jgi:hypothetical protein
MPLAVSWHHPPGQALDTRACSHQKHPALSWAQGEPYLKLQGEQGSTGDLHGKLAWYSPHSHCWLSYEIALKRYKIGYFQLSVIHAKIYHTLFTHICLSFGCYGMNYTVPSGNLTSQQTFVAHFGDDWPTWNMAFFGSPPSLGAKESKEHLDPSSAVHQSQQWPISTPLAAIRGEDLRISSNKRCGSQGVFRVLYMTL